MENICRNKTFEDVHDTYYRTRVKIFKSLANAPEQCRIQMKGVLLHHVSKEEVPIMDLDPFSRRVMAITSTRIVTVLCEWAHLSLSVAFPMAHYLQNVPTTYRACRTVHDSDTACQICSTNHDNRFQDPRLSCFLVDTSVNTWTQYHNLRQDTGP
jgi:hypothetical protein